MLCCSSSLPYLWASALLEQMWSRRRRAPTKVNGCMSVTVSSWRALFPTGLTLVAVSSDYSSWGLTLIKVLRQEQVLVEPVHKARRISCIFRAQSFLQGKKKILLTSMLHLKSLSHNFFFLFFLSEIPEVGWHSGKWHCTVRDRLWLLEVGVCL